MLLIKLCTPRRFDRVMQEVALRDILAVFRDEECHHRQLMQGAPPRMRTGRMAARQQRQHLGTEEAGASVKPRQDLEDNILVLGRLWPALPIEVGSGLLSDHE